MNSHSNQNCTISYHLNKKSTTIYIFFFCFLFCLLCPQHWQTEGVCSLWHQKTGHWKKTKHENQNSACVCVQERINIIYSAARNIMLKYHAVNAVKENMVIKWITTKVSTSQWWLQKPFHLYCNEFRVLMCLGHWSIKDKK